MTERYMAPMLGGEVPTLFESPYSKGYDSDVVLMGVPYEGILVADRHTPCIRPAPVRLSRSTPALGLTRPRRPSARPG